MALTAIVLDVEVEVKLGQLCAAPVGLAVCAKPYTGRKRGLQTFDDGPTLRVHKRKEREIAHRASSWGRAIVSLSYPRGWDDVERNDRPAKQPPTSNGGARWGLLFPAPGVLRAH